MPTLLQQLPFRVRSTIKRDEDASDAPPIGERYERYGKEKEQKFKLHVSWLETSESHIIAVELPGVEKSGIKLQKMGDQALQLSGEREDVLPLPKDDAKAKFRQKELRAATFSRVFKFPSKVKEIKATFTNGILTITVPKEHDTVMTIAIHASDCSGGGAGRKRRDLLLASGILTTQIVGGAARAIEAGSAAGIRALVQEAQEEWGRGLDPENPDRATSLDRACRIFDRIVAMDPARTAWLEGRGQVRVDAKRFEEAVADFDEAIRRQPGNYRAYSGRALAFEGLAQWSNAVADYTEALQRGRAATGYRDPYVMNSRGNALASLGRYKEALRDYSASFDAFQDARELDGAIYAKANAALMRIQVGDEANGLKELLAVARRAPGSIDMRAALAAVYWSMGRANEAEDEWEFACEKINSGRLFDGCERYKDTDWLKRIRRWPPVMIQHMDDFLRVRKSPSPDRDLLVTSIQDQVPIILERQNRRHELVAGDKGVGEGIDALQGGNAAAAAAAWIQRFLDGVLHAESPVDGSDEAVAPGEEGIGDGVVEVAEGADEHEAGHGVVGGGRGVAVAGEEPEAEEDAVAVDGDGVGEGARGVGRVGDVADERGQGAAHQDAGVAGDCAGDAAIEDLRVAGAAIQEQREEDDEYEEGCARWDWQCCHGQQTFGFLP
ncbi:hypothetical protein SELMODRAFT_447134 [Selaginella moellendorffii]|uniref:SHSP domain-containing protein n=1 Tax=Selaginella moellendorffii TaxID=88036 RepID=D8SX09_SELML|nr:hypothetical protein SELMODRAFT_447134 [Selaginella moellendorffii]